MIGCLSDTPADLEANDNDSLICDLAFSVFKDSFNVSNTFLASLTVSALSKALITLTFCDSFKFLALNNLLT